MTMAVQLGERPMSSPWVTRARELVGVCVDYFPSFLFYLSYGLRASLSGGGDNVTAQVGIDRGIASGASLSNIM